MLLTLKQARLLRGLTQKDMAKRLGVHEQTYMNWERNPDQISIRNAKFISEILDMDYNVIFFGQDSNLIREETKKIG